MARWSSPTMVRTAYGASPTLATNVPPSRTRRTRVLENPTPEPGLTQAFVIVFEKRFTAEGAEFFSVHFALSVVKLPCFQSLVPPHFPPSTFGPPSFFWLAPRFT